MLFIRSAVELHDSAECIHIVNRHPSVTESAVPVRPDGAVLQPKFHISHKLCSLRSLRPAEEERFRRGQRHIDISGDIGAHPRAVGLQVPGNVHRIAAGIAAFIHIDVNMSSISVDSGVIIGFYMSAAQLDLPAAAAHGPGVVDFNIHEPLDIDQSVMKCLHSAGVNKKTGVIIFFRTVVLAVHRPADPHPVIPGIVIIDDHAKVISLDKPGSRGNGTGIIVIRVAGQIQEPRIIDGDRPGIHGPYICTGDLRHSLYPAEVVHFQIMPVEIQGEVMLSVMLPLVDDRRRGQHIAWIRGSSLTAEKGINRRIYFKIIGNSITGDTTFHIGFIFVQVSC